MKVIDAHAHLVHNPAGLDQIAESGEFEEIWIMDLSDIGELAGYQFADQAEVLEITRRYPGFFRAYGFIDLDRDPPEQVRKLRDLGFIGLKPYKQLKPYSDPGYFPLYAEAEKLGMPILFHTGLIAQSRRYSGEVTRGFGPENMHPAYLASIAEAFPGLSIVAGHLGWPFWEEMEENYYYYANITGDISGYRKCIDRLPALLDRRAHDGTDRYFNEKLHFATDEFYGTPESNARALKIKHFWELYFELIGSVYYRWGAPEEREKFFRGNALKLLKESLKES